MNPPHKKDIINLISPDIAWRYRIIPNSVNGNTLRLLVDETVFKSGITGELELITGFDIQLVVEKQNTIQELLTRYYHHNNLMVNKVATIDTSNSDDFLLKIIYEAKHLKCSDLHIEAYAEKCRVRFRIDGKLIERYRLTKEEYPSITNKIKIKAQLDIAEKRLPQDGRILISNQNDKVDIRVSILPSLHGEKIVLRLLSNESSNIVLESLGLDNKQLSDVKKVLHKPHGIILISGPTGSGKTTTLYATLKLLNNEYTNILTIEDPIEYTLDGINQVQLKESIGFGFANALRTFLRQDPDIIMLGEIRDAETAQMAIRAALTGHLVLSTIHTNSAWGTVSRLIDMGVPTFLLANTLNLTIAQRLLRKLCIHCKQQKPFVYDENNINLAEYFPEGALHYYATGCEHCFYTGYSGRMAIYEVIPLDNEMSILIKEGVYDISEQIKEKKISTLKDRAIQLILTGETSIEEAYPVLLNF